MRLKFLAVGIAAVVAVGLWQVRADQGFEPKRAKIGDLIAQGDYLVNRVTLCGTCHTPRDDHGNLDERRQLRGATVPIRPKQETQNWVDKSPDITPSGLTGKWGEEGMIEFLTTGTDPNGHLARHPMPPYRLNKHDASAIYQYLKSLPTRDEGVEK